MRMTAKATGLFLLLVASPLSMASIVMDVEITCPIGGERFEATVAMSGTQFGQNLDRRPFGPTVSPWPISKCPSNGFVIYKNDFTASEIDQLMPYVNSVTYQTLQKHESDYYLAARLMQHLGAPKSAIADALLKATWEAEQDNRYERYANEALTVFEALLADLPHEFSPEQAASYQQIAGELERRLGLFDKAIRRFKALIDAPGVKGSELEKVVCQEIALTEAKDSGTQPYNDAPRP